jgi:hypothetical protein
MAHPKAVSHPWCSCKGALGVIWTAATFGSLCVTLLIEPQVNPIKHFPLSQCQLILRSDTADASVRTDHGGNGGTVAGTIAAAAGSVRLAWSGETGDSTKRTEARLELVILGHHGGMMIDSRRAQHGNGPEALRQARARVKPTLSGVARQACTRSCITSKKD